MFLEQAMSLSNVKVNILNCFITIIYFDYCKVEKFKFRLFVYFVIALGNRKKA